MMKTFLDSTHAGSVEKRVLRKIAQDIGDVIAGSVDNKSPDPRYIFQDTGNFVDTLGLLIVLQEEAAFQLFVE